jgi:hypothetical protein
MRSKFDCRHDSRQPTTLINGVVGVVGFCRRRQKSKCRLLSALSALSRSACATSISSLQMPTKSKLSALSVRPLVMPTKALQPDTPNRPHRATLLRAVHRLTRKPTAHRKGSCWPASPTASSRPNSFSLRDAGACPRDKLTPGNGRACWDSSTYSRADGQREGQ